MSDLLYWQRLGLATPDRKTQQLIESSRRENRLVNIAKGISSSLRLGISLAGGWFVAFSYGLLVERFRPQELMDTFGYPLCYSCLLEFLLVVAGIGAAVGVAALGRKLVNATAGAALFLLLAIGNGISSMNIFGSVGRAALLVRNLPVGLAFFVACLLLPLQRHLQIIVAGYQR